MIQIRCVPAILLVGMLTTLVACGPAGEERDLDELIYQAVNGTRTGDVVDLGPVFGTDWDRLVFFDGDPGLTTIKEALGFDWPGYSPGMRDGTTVVMVRDATVVRWAYLPTVTADSSGELVAVELVDPWVEIDPETAVFVVKEAKDAGPVILCYVPAQPRLWLVGFGTRWGGCLSSGPRIRRPPAPWEIVRKFRATWSAARLTARRGSGRVRDSAHAGRLQF